jgi:hypothetical protein
LYTSCVLDCALRFLMIFLLLIKKKKKISLPYSYTWGRTTKIWFYDL